MKNPAYTENYNDILEISGFSKNFLRKIKNILFNLQAENYSLINGVLTCEFVIGTLRIPFSSNISGVKNIQKLFHPYFDLIEKLKNNHSLYNSSFRNTYSKFYHLTFYKVNDKYYLSPKYEFNSTENDTIIKSVDDLYDIVMAHIKHNGFAVTEEFLFVPANSLISDLKTVCNKVITHFRREGYHTTACLYQQWNEPYFIFQECSVYDSPDEESIKKAIFAQNLSQEKKGWIHAFYPSIYLPETSSDRRHGKKRHYQIESDLKNKVYNKSTFEKTYHITPEFKKEFKTLFKIK